MTFRMRGSLIGRGSINRSLIDRDIIKQKKKRGKGMGKFILEFFMAKAMGSKDPRYLSQTRKGRGQFLRGRQLAPKACSR